MICIPSHLAYFWFLSWLVFSFEYFFSKVVPPFADLHCCFSFPRHGIFCWEHSVVQAFYLTFNSFNFCLSRKDFISSSNLNVSFAGYRILGRQPCSFRAWNILVQVLLAFRVWVEKLAAICIGIHVYVIWCFSFATFKILSLFWMLVIFIITCLGVDLFWFCAFGVL